MPYVWANQDRDALTHQPISMRIPWGTPHSRANQQQGISPLPQPISVGIPQPASQSAAGIPTGQSARGCLGNHPHLPANQQGGMPQDLCCWANQLAGHPGALAGGPISRGDTLGPPLMGQSAGRGSCQWAYQGEGLPGDAPHPIPPANEQQGCPGTPTSGPMSSKGGCECRNEQQRVLSVSQ